MGRHRAFGAFALTGRDPNAGCPRSPSARGISTVVTRFRLGFTPKSSGRSLYGEVGENARNAGTANLDIGGRGALEGDPARANSQIPQREDLFSRERNSSSVRLDPSVRDDSR